MILSEEEFADVGERVLASRTIPEYCQNYIYNLQVRLAEAKNEVERLEQAHTLLKEYDWYSLGVHTKERRKLFMIDRDSITTVCAIGAGSVVLIGTKKEEA